MDNLTHTLVGVALARAGLGRRLPRASLVLALAANGPDIDAIAWAFGSLAHLRYHRGLTHSLVGVPLVAALAVLVARLLAGRRGREFSWPRAGLACLTAVATHPLLDLTNIYGIRPWLPFSSTWYSQDIVYIVDPWIWAALAAALAGPALGRLISGEIGAPAGAGRAAALLALLFLPAWWGLRGVFHSRALRMLEAHTYAGEAPRRVAAFPTPLSPFRWTGYVETEGFQQLPPVDVLGSLDPARGRVLYRPEPSPTIQAALRTETARHFSVFARYRHESVERHPDGWRVTLTDLRFAGERPNAFVCSIVLDAGLRVVREGFSF